MAIDVKQLSDSLQAQFQGLNGRHPGMWPIAPRILCTVGVVVGVVAAGYFGYWSGQFEEQEAGAAKEARLKTEYTEKSQQAVNLEALRAQKVQVDQYVERLQKQLPSKAEMAALLSDINQAGLGRGLQFELFKPGQVVVKDYYAELPINIKVTGSYHDIGAFASDMANLPRIVTLNNMQLSAPQAGSNVLTLDAVAKTFRYLDPEEVAAQRKAAADKKKGAKK
jgi:type IV pilus assembly protein PilO